MAYKTGWLLVPGGEQPTAWDGGQPTAGWNGPRAGGKEGKSKSATEVGVGKLTQVNGAVVACPASRNRRGGLPDPSA